MLHLPLKILTQAHKKPSLPDKRRVARLSRAFPAISRRATVASAVPSVSPVRLGGSKRVCTCSDDGILLNFVQIRPLYCVLAVFCANGLLLHRLLFASTLTVTLVSVLHALLVGSL
ncbi:protein kinase superfamily protein [Striga asiatica]|uniref:Protein kinase superfamily protein n=1 Tax=Striga asiatica TaxID=4170 RepID=A0A5A7QYD8_STRAF|nr:protein kinase superfamily protein [Striga asiatica]